MPEKILVAVAWPYANANIHVGNITGAYLPADIFARYHRLKGNEVIMVSGSDAHGTPITVRADAEGRQAEEVYKGFSPLSAADIAETILFILSRPAHVNIDDIIVMPTDQAYSRDFNRKE